MPQITRICLILAALLLAHLGPAAAAPPPVLALVHGRLIDGTGAAPIDDAAVLIAGERITAVGRSGEIAIPKDARRIDLRGATILPGFFNAHVHGGFDARNLETWAQAGVTTVRDLGIGGNRVQEMLAFRDRELKQPRYARLLSAGPMLGVPGGYGALFVTSAADARAKVNDLIDAGVDQIKICLEDGYAGVSGLPKPSAEEIQAMIEAAHARGKTVVAHITQSAYLRYLLDFKVDEFAHLPYDWLTDTDIARIAAKGIRLTPTFTVYRNYGAAAACGVELDLGSVEKGKIADLLVVEGDPLQDLGCLENVRLVVHYGAIIRE
ncbi:MAG: amidohydrolase family protein [Bacteroidota bacterium]